MLLQSLLRLCVQTIFTYTLLYICVHANLYFQMRVLLYISRPIPVREVRCRLCLTQKYCKDALSPQTICWLMFEKCSVFIRTL